MEENRTGLILVNFGGPRTLEEVPDFLEALLTDSDVIRTPFPKFLQHWFFKRIAAKRAPIVREEYKKIGGGSPIFADTEWMAAALEKKMNRPVVTFHRYLRSTHAECLEKIRKSSPERWLIFPLFPQFSYATAGSIARWFSEHVEPSVFSRMKWIKSYCREEGYIKAFAGCIREFLWKENLPESDVQLLFSAHGLPEQFIQEGDPYQSECEASFSALSSEFSKARSILAYQSQFGRAKWIGPSTLSLCQDPSSWASPGKSVVIVPLSFTSDHIETLFEIEMQYVSLLKEKGVSAYRCPALNRREDWVDAIVTILRKGDFVSGESLIRR